MVFNSLTFAAFFAFVLLIHNLPLSWNTRKRNLLVLSYLFYSAWNPPFVALLWISTVVDWIAARKLAVAENPMARRGWMLLSVVANLGMLLFFKYGNFLLDSFASLLAAVGVIYHPPAYDIVLPMGISFYTFATMCYTIDIYYRKAEPAKNFLDYALFVTFFPHLVAGPIMRPTELVPQFAEPRRANGAALQFGLALMTLGLFQKVVLADGFLAPVAEAIFDEQKAPGMLDAWVATLAFGAQILCDFSGYSTTAIGAAMCLGFAMPDNFRFPYAAVGFSDFWRRWHITLSSWLRDYLYIPLGGNRHGPLRTYSALMTTMLVGGLWHGASWTFVVWGGLHGVYLAAERWVRSQVRPKTPGTVSLLLYALLTYLCVHVAWVFFRAHSFARARDVIGGMFGTHPGAGPLLTSYQLVTAAVIVPTLLAVHWRMRDTTLESVLSRTPAQVIAMGLALMAFAIFITQGSGNAFIYFQF